MAFGFALVMPGGNLNEFVTACFQWKSKVTVEISIKSKEKVEISIDK